MAVSIDLLAFYRSLFERSCDAINALASALRSHYVRRGFRIVNKHVCLVSSYLLFYYVTSSQNEAVHDPFQRGLGFSVQWFDVLHVEVERRIEASLQVCREQVKASKVPQLTPTTPIPRTPNRTKSNSSYLTTPSKYGLSSMPTSAFNLVASPSTVPTLSSGCCASILVQRCPACFAGTTFGQPLADGGDIHVAMDGNFHHRHCRSAGTSPPFYDPAYFLPKHQVDEIGTHIEKQRKSPLKARKTLVPDEAIDSCESSYEAADGKKQKTSMDNFDDTGIMALICRHDIPLFFANIDTPGEQQKYAVALLAHLFTLLPSQATVVGLYDVGCVLDRSISLVSILAMFLLISDNQCFLEHNIFPEQVAARLRFATTAMHAYGHEWACQLIYNPCLAPGLGLSDGEGTERLWSRLIKLIGIERSSSVRLVLFSADN